MDDAFSSGIVYSLWHARNTDVFCALTQAGGPMPGRLGPMPRRLGPMPGRLGPMPGRLGPMPGLKKLVLP